MSTKYILSSSIDLFYVVTDEDGKIIGSNDLFKEYCSHIQPHKVSDIISDEPDLDNLVDAISRSKKAAPFPVRLYAKTKQKNNSLRWNLWNIYYILDSIHFVGLPITDVTSITAHEYEKQRQLLEEFRFMLSHELRQPLTSIAGVVKLLIESKDKSIGDENLEMIMMVNDQVKKLDQVIHTLVKKATRQF